MKTSPCPKDYFKRKPYTVHRKSGASYKVRGKCIPSTRAPGKRSQRRSDWVQKVNQHKRRSRQLAVKAYAGVAPTNCPKGQILRDGYVMKRGVIVPPTCIKDRGNPGKGTDRIGPLKKGTLGQYGYEHVRSMSKDQRETALTQAVKQLGWLPVWRKLNAIHVLTKNTHPSLSRIFSQDRNWVKNTFSTHQ